jgi:hypothetical protein
MSECLRLRLRLRLCLCLCLCLCLIDGEICFSAAL